MIERAEFVADRTLRLTRRCVGSVPVDLFAIADELGIELLSLSKQLADGQDRETIFAWWGNDDGAASAFGERCVVGYNDKKPRRRVRFTLAEEIMHVVLGHVFDRRFMAGDILFDKALYAKYEAEARLGAGLLLCHPVVAYRYGLDRKADSEPMMHMFDISRECAFQTAADLREYKRVIQHCPVYGRLAMPRVRTSVALASAESRAYWRITPSAAEMERM